MFGKLLKYEIKAAGKWYLLLYAITIILSPLLGIGVSNWLRTSLESTTSIFTLSDSIYSLAIIVLVALVVSLGIATLFLVINRFYKNIYGREGYLTLTLPVNSHQIILSKLVAALIWMLASTATVFSAFYLFIAPITDLPNLLVMLPNALTEISKYVSLPLLALTILTSQLAGILLIYLSISIGQLFQNRRGLMGCVAYVIIYIFISFISSIVMPQLMLEDLASNKYLLFLLAFALAEGLVCYLITNYIMTHKLNIQ